MRFLFITKEYPPNPDASGAIVKYISDELKKQNHIVDVIARDKTSHIDEYALGNIYWIEMSIWGKLQNKIRDGHADKKDKLLYFVLTYIRKFLLMLRIRKFPDSECAMTKKIVKMYDTYLKNTKYDCVIGFFRPYSCLSAATQIATKMQKAKCIACYFDLVDAKSRPSFMPLALYKTLIMKGDLRIMDASDCVMLPMSAKKKRDLVLNMHKNAVYYEFPTFIVRDSKDIELISSNASICEDEEQNIVKFVFAGTMTHSYRNPSIMLEVLNLVAEHCQDVSFRLDVFGGGDCADVLNSFSSKKNLRVYYHGRVPKATVEQYEKQADFLINIMNAFEGIVPSKIFELFVSGKPILNFISEMDDGSMGYINKYPLCYTVDWKDANQDERSKIIDVVAEYIVKNKGNRVDVELIKPLYNTCTPQYVAEQIVLISGDNKIE